MDTFNKNLIKFLMQEDCGLNKVNNADEIGLIWGTLARRTFVLLCGKTTPGLEINKNRVATLLCERHRLALASAFNNRRKPGTSIM